MRILLFLLLISSELFGQQEFFHAQNKGLLLDEYPNAAAAYSLRRVNSRYTGALIRVRRDSTGQAEQDIGSIGEALDTVALKAFVRNNSGYVTTWYDQSGNGRNATQTTAASQPRIVNAGVVEYDGTKPAIYFNGISYRIGASTISALSTSSSSFYLVGRGMGVSTNPFSPGIVRIANGDAFANTTAPSLVLLGGVPAATYAQYYWGAGFGINASVEGNLLGIFSTIISGNTTIDVYRNGVLKQTGTRTPTSWATTTFSVGFGSSITNLYRQGFAQEFILYSTSNANKTQIEQNINSYYAIY